MTTPGRKQDEAADYNTPQEQMAFLQPVCDAWADLYCRVSNEIGQEESLDTKKETLHLKLFPLLTADVDMFGMVGKEKTVIPTVEKFFLESYAKNLYWDYKVVDRKDWPEEAFAFASEQKEPQLADAHWAATGPVDNNSLSCPLIAVFQFSRYWDDSVEGKRKVAHNGIELIELEVRDKSSSTQQELLNNALVKESESRTPPSDDFLSARLVAKRFAYLRKPDPPEPATELKG
ncbi:unnamed protein product [Amoebophrya sp. A120]|nr:unnamed protein product [Amoebophrya sp. A120]|eukprot:GSA120T00011219001.1